MAYNKVIGGGKEVLLLDISGKEVLLLNILGEDEDTWRNDSGVLTGTRLDIFGEESSKEIKVASLEEPVKH